MHQATSRRSKRTVRRREELDSSSDDSNNPSSSRLLIDHSHPTSEPTLPSSIVPAPSSNLLMTTSRRIGDTQTTQDTSSAQLPHTKSVPAFAETQLLSIYYLNRNISNQATNQDTCVFIEQQERQPVRFRATYDPSAATRSTQTSPPISVRQLSTHGSTLIVDNNPLLDTSNNRVYEQRLKIHSGSQRLANSPPLNRDNDEPLSPSEQVEESRYSYEEYIIHVDNNQAQALQKQASSSSPTSTSSVTTIIAQPSSPPPSLPSPPPPPPPVVSLPRRAMLQPDELDSDRTSRLSGDDVNTHSSASSMSGSFTNQDWPTTTTPSSTPANRTSIVNTASTTRISSWPPVPYDLPAAETPFETSFVLDESDEQRRPSRVQFAEQLVRVIPPSATNSLSEEAPPLLPFTVSAPTIIPRTSTTRSTTYEQAERPMIMDVDEDDTTTGTTTTTTSSEKPTIPGHLQRTSGVTNLNELMIKRPTIAPPPPPSQPSSSSTSGVDPRLVREQLQRLDYELVVDTRHPVNQSKWVKDRIDATDAPTSTMATAGRVDALRSLFEQQSGRSSDSSTLNSPTGQIRRKEPEERPSRHGDEIRFRVKEDKAAATVHHVEPMKIVPRTKPPSSTVSAIAPLTWEELVGVQEEHKQRQQKPPQVVSPSSSVSTLDLEEVRHITGKRIRSLDEVQVYLQVRIKRFSVSRSSNSLLSFSGRSFMAMGWCLLVQFNTGTAWTVKISPTTIPFSSGQRGHTDQWAQRSVSVSRRFRR